MTEEKSLMERLEAESADLEARRDATAEFLKLDPDSQYLRDTAEELKRGAEHLRMLITKLRSMD